MLCCLLENLSSLPEYQVPETLIPGAGGKEIWVFQAVGAGKTEITLQYVRPWEKGMAPSQTATFVVVVR